VQDTTLNEIDNLALRFENRLGLFCENDSDRVCISNDQGLDILGRPHFLIEEFFGTRAWDSWDGHRVLDKHAVLFFTDVDFLYVVCWNISRTSSSDLGVRVDYEDIAAIRPDLNIDQLVSTAWFNERYDLLLELFFSAFDSPSFNSTRDKQGGYTHIQPFREIDMTHLESQLSPEKALLKDMRSHDFYLDDLDEDPVTEVRKLELIKELNSAIRKVQKKARDCGFVRKIS
jgi:hypothetical protein